MNWQEWKSQFWQGHTPIIYLMMADVATVFALLIQYHDSWVFYPYLIASVASYAVFTDEVAHLYPYNVRGDITPAQWLRKAFRGRTHDVYGMIITIAMVLIPHSTVAMRGIGAIIVLLSLLQIGGFAYTKFYH